MYITLKDCSLIVTMGVDKGYDLNSRAPIASANFISDGKVQVQDGACQTNESSVIQDQWVGTK